MYTSIIKRFLDYVSALMLLIILSPILLMVFLVLSFNNKGKPFFIQPRPGKNEKVFWLIKFKTMTDAKDEHNILLSDSKRLTKTGKFIRKTSLDELPQLVNVVLGDMSLIGPRPLLVRYLPYYSLNEKRRHDVLPGITGLAQVSGRNNLSWDDKLALDVNYVDNISFFLDLKIFFKTIKNVLSSKDIVVDAGTLIKDLDEYRTKA